MTTLLEKAKNYNPKTKPSIYTNEHIELVLAWLVGEITYSQVSVALANGEKEKKNNQMYKIANMLKEAYKLGYLNINKLNK